MREEPANNSDDAPADGIQGDHAEQQERQHNQRGAALSGAVSPCDRHFGSADEQCTGEEHSSELGQP